VPNFYDLQDNAEAGFIKRSIGRYFFTRNYERSIRIHRAIGSPLVRKVVMGTVGRISQPGSGGSYRLDHSRSRLESAVNFSVRGSVFNEVVHTFGALPSAVDAAYKLATGQLGQNIMYDVAASGVI
jgi:hypothetical protein